MKPRIPNLLVASAFTLNFNTACAETDSDVAATVEAAPAEAAAVPAADNAAVEQPVTNQPAVAQN